MQPMHEVGQDRFLHTSQSGHVPSAGQGSSTHSCRSSEALEERQEERQVELRGNDHLWEGGVAPAPSSPGDQQAAFQLH